VRVTGVEPAGLEAVIFDVDGTLVNSVDAYHIAAGRAAQPYGWPVTREMVRSALNGDHGFWDRVIPAERAGDAALVEALREATWRHWPRVLDEHVRVLPGLEATLDALEGAGLRLGIFTGSGGEAFAPLERSGLLERFEVVLTATDVSRAKPHPEGVLRCVERLGVAPARAAYVGDSVPDMAAALAADCLAVGVLSGAGDSELLSAAGAHRLARDHRGLPGILIKNT